jgi:hypothetical protein
VESLVEGTINLSAVAYDENESKTDVCLSGEWQGFIILNFEVMTDIVNAGSEYVSSSCGLAPTIFNGYSEAYNYFSDSTGNSVKCDISGAQNIIINVYKDTERVILGDVSGDGLVTNSDVLMIFRYIYNPALYPLDVEAGDVNGDGDITNADVLKIFRYIYDPRLYPIE